jgi:hypothetical protein
MLAADNLGACMLRSWCADPEEELSLTRAPRQHPTAPWPDSRIFNVFTLWAHTPSWPPRVT